MTVFVGKNIIVKVNTVQVAEAKEFSVEVNNGKQDCYVLGESTIDQFVYTLQDASGSMSMHYVNKAFIDDVTTHGTTKTLTLELYDNTPALEFTVTLTEVVYTDIGLSFSPEEAISAELSFKAETFSIA